MENTRMFRKAEMIFLIAVTVLLVGCVSKPDSESQIKKTVGGEFADYCGQSDMTDITVVIDQRDTDKKAKTDAVSGSVTGSSPSVKYEGTFKARYILFNNGWQLDRISFDSLKKEIIIAPVDEPMLEKDVLPVFISDFCSEGLKVDEHTVSSNTVDADKGVDSITYKINVSREEASGYYLLDVEYKLRNHVWSYSRYEVSDYDYTITACNVDWNAADTLVMTELASEYDEINRISNGWEEGTGYAQALYEGRDYTGYLVDVGSAAVEYRFDLRSGWGEPYISENTGVTESDWDVLGEWTYSDSENSIWLNIISIDRDTNEITYEYDVELKNAPGQDFFTGTWKNLDLHSKGPVTEEIYSNQWPLDLIMRTDYEMYNPSHFELDPYKGVWYDYRGFGYKDDTYILTYKNAETAARVMNDPASEWPPESFVLTNERIVRYWPGIRYHESSWDYQGKVWENTLAYADSNGEGTAYNTYNLYGFYKTLTGYIYLPEGAKPGDVGTLDVYGDGKRLAHFDSSAFTDTECADSFSIDVTGVHELEIRAGGECNAGPGILNPCPFIGFSNLIVTRSDSLPAGFSATGPTDAPVSTSDVQVGAYVIFGSYEQNNDTSDGKEDIEWQVLAKDGGRALLISRYALESRPYHDDPWEESVTWENSSLREWLNGTFIGYAFSTDEQAAILDTMVIAEDHPIFGTDAGNDTTDKIFLLSVTEVAEYFGPIDEARKCAATDFAITQGVLLSDSDYVGDRAACVWWLRSPGSSDEPPFEASCVAFWGEAEAFRGRVNNEFGVRPVMWVDFGS